MFTCKTLHSLKTAAVACKIKHCKNVSGLAFGRSRSSGFEDQLSKFLGKI